MAEQQKTDRPAKDKKWHAVAILMLVTITFLLYASTLGHGFIFIWDDHKYVINNLDIRGFTADNLKAVFSKYYIGNYAPLHLMSYMLDYQFWGLNPVGYHLSNIMVHAFNGVLVYRLFTKLELPEVPALVGAALFVLHPVQVESVAWVAERKNLLSACFFLLALLAYIDYKTNPLERVKYYICSLVFLACALLSKSAAVVFPLIIICYDFCYCHAPHRLKLLDKLPFLLLSLAAALLTILSQDKSILDYPGGTPLTALWTMMPVFLSYLKDLIYPFDLSPYYMTPIKTTIDGGVVISAIMLLCLGVAGAMSVKRRPHLLFFVCLFIISLLPVMQIIPIITLKNDRYLYFPMIGAAGATGIVISVLMSGSTRLRNITVAVAVVFCMILGGTAYNQSLIWKDNITLWRFAIKQDPNNMLAWLMLAKGYTKRGNAADAVTAINSYNELKSKHGSLRGWEGEW